MDYERIAELLFPESKEGTEYYEEKYPPRDLPEGAKVTRLGPSPTGFIHLGNLYGAFVDERLAHQSGGVFYLRIEDTDDKRQVEGAVKMITDSLSFFGIDFDEGAFAEGDRGEYGDYTQSHRAPVYHAFAKKLVAEGKAYPCFITEEEITDIREAQEEAKLTPGIYGEYARDRELDYEAVKANIEAGKPYVVRLKSTGKPAEGDLGGGADGSAPRSASQGIRIKVKDAIRGILDMPENFHDVVILKKNGIPTYHFAHAVDDHLMRTTHVVRGAEWLPSLPIHEELFRKLGFELPIYCHTAQLMKLTPEGNKRKLSKRLDPELSLGYYREQGYHPKAVREYLLTILNSNYEEWRTANPDADIDEFPFTTEKMSNSGALFDLNKLNDVSKDALLRVPAPELYDFLYSWAEEYRPEAAEALRDREYVEKILDIGRNDQKPRKDFICASQMLDFISYFFDDLYAESKKDEMPAEVPAEDVPKILEAYLATYDHSDDQSAWFDKIRTIATELGYAAKPKDYKKNPDQYKGHVGHVSTVIRIALMGRSQSPDVHTIQQIMGEEMVLRRIGEALA